MSQEISNNIKNSISFLEKNNIVDFSKNIKLELQSKIYKSINTYNKDFIKEFVK